jgi:uncharacterized protein YjbJ (UPF0337 family)
MWNRDEVRGKAEQVKGRAKQAVGDLTDDEEMKGEGEAQEIGGKVQDTIGRGRRVAGEAIEEIGKNLKR